MRRGAAIGVVTVIVVGGCVLAVNSLIGGGTVRTPRWAPAPATTAGHEVAADVNGKPGKDGASSANGGTSAAGPGISFAAVGDTMLGNTPELPADPDAYSTT